MPEVQHDAKELASLTFADVIRATANNFPDPRYRLERVRPGSVGGRYAIKNLGEHGISGNCDGVGTKPELAERLFEWTGDYACFEQPAFDLVAMVADDAAREGHFVAAIQNNLDLGHAEDSAFVTALAQGMRRACDAGRFALLSGETAELGYRTPGYGRLNLNWNAAAIVLVNERKMFHPEALRPGQPVVALRECSVRSNGLTRARAILEQAFLSHMHCQRKRDYVMRDVHERIGGILTEQEIGLVLDVQPGAEGLWQRIQLPWHTIFPEITQKLARPSTIYAPLTYEAQGGVDGDVCVPIVAAAHISGGGIPLKTERMLKLSGLGMHLDPVFPDPEGIPELIELARKHPHPQKGILVDERSACEQWNRGIGFLCVVEHQQRADELIALAESLGYEAAVAGEIIPERKIEWRGHTWDY